jgi:hypothetical protein
VKRIRMAAAAMAMATVSTVAAGTVVGVAPAGARVTGCFQVGRTLYTVSTGADMRKGPGKTFPIKLYFGGSYPVKVVDSCPSSTHYYRVSWDVFKKGWIKASQLQKTP